MKTILKMEKKLMALHMWLKDVVKSVPFLFTSLHFQVAYLIPWI